MYSSEMLVPMYQIMWRHISDDGSVCTNVFTMIEISSCTLHYSWLFT